MLECILRKTLTGEIPRVVLITITLLDVNNKKGKKLQLHQKDLCIQYEISSVNNFKQLEKWVIHISDVHITNFTYGQIPFNDVVIILIADADLRFIFIFINFNIELFNILLLFFFCGLFVEKMLPNWISASNKQLVAHRAVTSTGEI